MNLEPSEHAYIHDVLKHRPEWEGKGMPHDAFLLIVHVSRQCVLVTQSEDVLARFPVSTSRLGLGSVVDSEMTPAGLHEVVERYGDGLPPGARFVGRVFTGEVLSPDRWQAGEQDMILSRILRLSGTMPGLNLGGNVDTYERLIYFHGTDKEHYVGVKPSSRGCIRMRNVDIVELYDMLAGHPAWCWIGPAPS